MGCHGQVWNDSVLLEPVRRSYFNGQPIAWNRVHDLPDFVYFDHSIHLAKGVPCVTCHGRVDQMPRVYKVAPMTMRSRQFVYFPARFMISTEIAAYS